jgi:excisionase family DNA binding protein
LLNRLGHRSGKGHTWTELRVRSYRNDHGIAVYREGEREQRGEVTLEQAAKVLGLSTMTVLRMIATGAIAATQACRSAPWVIMRSELDRPELHSSIRPARRTPLTADPVQIPLELQ